METRQVVSVFLTSGGRVMIVRRSDRVGSYRGYWSGVSGYLEGEPLAHALVEIREETGLAAEELTLLRRPGPLEVSDPVNGVLWRIHPFLFAVRDPDRVRLDWENAELRWILPGEMVRFQTVPSLEQVLAACLGEEGLPGGLVNQSNP